MRLNGYPIRAGLVLAVMTLLAASGCAVPQPRGGGELSRVIEPTTQRAYWRYLPEDYVKATPNDRKSRRWPLVVSFHGMKPFDNAVSQAKEWETEADRYGFIVISPELRAPDVLAQFPVRTVHPAFKSDELAALAILDHALVTTDADPQHVLSTSWSSGGYMAHYMLNRHPDRFTCLAVRQSNFSFEILDAEMAKRSRYHPILIVNTENDFAICKRESKEAVSWYENQGYKNMAWVYIKSLGHERTPDMAATFFGFVARAEPSRPPAILARRQAIDGNSEGLAFLSGNAATMEPAPERFARRPVNETVVRAARGDAPVSTQTRQPASPQHPTAQSPSNLALAKSPVSIRLNTGVGVEPLHLAFSVDCPSDWLQTAQFLWTVDGVAACSGVNGQKTITEPGDHLVGLLVVTRTGEEFRSSRRVRVLPRLEAHASSQ